MKHMQGPWKKLNSEIITETGALICSLKAGSSSHWHNSKAVSAAESDRNGNLIAAAPDLLKACKKTLTNIEYLCKAVCNLSGNSKKVRYEDFADKLIDAIVKAEPNDQNNCRWKPYGYTGLPNKWKNDLQTK